MRVGGEGAFLTSQVLGCQYFSCACRDASWLVACCRIISRTTACFALRAGPITPSAVAIYAVAVTTAAEAVAAPAAAVTKTTVTAVFIHLAATTLDSAVGNALSAAASPAAVVGFAAISAAATGAFVPSP